MARYDKKCSWCGYECEMELPMNHLPQGCRNPDVKDCPGVMETMFKTVPGLTRAACPTRHGYNDGVKYKVRGTDS